MCFRTPVNIFQFCEFDILFTVANLFNQNVVFTNSRTMYYTDWFEGHIAKASYNGSDVIVLQDSNILRPNALAADFNSKQGTSVCV